MAISEQYKKIDLEKSINLSSLFDDEESKEIIDKAKKICEMFNYVNKTLFDVIDNKNQYHDHINHIYDFCVKLCKTNIRNKISQREVI